MDLGTVLTVVDLVQKSIIIYKRYENLPQQMAKLGRRMERLQTYLNKLEAFVKSKPTTALEALYGGQQHELMSILAHIKTDAAKVYDLFDRYQKGILSRSLKMEFRSKWISNLWFSLVDSSPEKVQAIMDDIDRDRDELSHLLQLMSVEGIVALVANMKTAQPRPGRARTRDDVTVTPQRVFPSPSPSPATPPRKDYRILFVDPYNTARSVVAEALIKLLGQLTLKAGGDWRIAQAESAGFFVKTGSNCVDVVDKLDYSFKTFKKPWMAGGEKAASTALAAVFDNKWCDYPFKKTIREEMTARTSRGLQKDMFASYDYVIVFTRREHDNMVKLKDALQKKAGSKGTSTRGKGRVLQLGTFLSPEAGLVREIMHPSGVDSDGDSVRSRQKWNQTAADIKVALKEFLRQEMDWRQPDDKKKTTGAQNLGPGRA